MSPQQTIAHYRIVSKLGEGGMGEVWRATDTKLNRDVAIKILPQAFAQDADRMVRFAREAQVLASLNHPNIAAIYGVEENAIVMELVEGAAPRGPMPLERALPLIHELIDALEYAHEKGVVHRDLKPANLKLTPDGRIKVLDFGLAKALASEATAARNPEISPTLTMRATEAGMIMGTAAYMAPEQARGQNVDRRADIWAFGVVTYELLMGAGLFGAATTSDTLAAVLTKEPNLDAVPARVRRLLEACLVKDPRRRLGAIGDARLLLDEMPAAAAPRRRSALPWAVAAMLALSLAVTGALLWRATQPVDHPLTRLNVDLGPDAMTGLDLTAAISPDGRRLVFPARGPDGRQRFATRLLDQASTTMLAGTEGGDEPFFSPDGQWIGFYASNQLKKISVLGGAPVTLHSIAGPGPGGASWGEDGNVVLPIDPALTLSRIPAAGGAALPLTKLGPGESAHRWPQVLPGGSAVLFTASTSPVAWDNANIEAISLKSGQVKIVQSGGYYGRYLPGGYLVYVHQGVLFGVKFDPARLETRGAPVPILEDLAANPTTGGGQFDFSNTGTFVYAAGKTSAQVLQIAWLDSSGKTQPLIAAPGAYVLPRLSPDGRKLAFGNRSDIYLHDLVRDTTTRLMFSGGSISPVWAPDGKHIVFLSGGGFFWVRSDGAGDPQRVLERSNTMVPWSFSPDGRRLAYFENGPDTGSDIWTLPLDLTDPDHPKPGKPEPFLRTPAEEIAPRFSPDGRWIAYRSNESGSDEIYVRPFPAGSGGKWQISSGGGLYGLWANNDRELFYETADNRIMLVDYSVDGASFVAGKPRLWSDRQLFYAGTSNLDLAADGKRFAVLSLPETATGEKGSVHVTILLNFFDELKRRIP